ncbi:unnamed protein product [Closterium sp. Yama58-4]|nr:unnamed protein product [Closterium sp. Yama58-4]
MAGRFTPLVVSHPTFKKLLVCPTDWLSQHGMAPKVETAGGVGERVAALEAKLREQGGEMAALKAEIARMRAAAERQAAEVAEVKATAVHSEARINDAELALAAIKDERKAEKIREEREAGSGEGHGGGEIREGKRRKWDEAGNEEEMADAPAGAGRAVIAGDDAAEGERYEAEREGEAEEEEKGEDLDDEVQNLRARVEALEETNTGGGKLWEELIATWVEVLPGRTHVDLIRASFVTDDALSRLTSLRSLTRLSLRESIGFTAEGVTQLFPLTALTSLDLSAATVITDASLEGIGSLLALSTLCLGKTYITDEGIKRLQGLSQLTDLSLYVCPSVSSASMVHVGKLTALTSLRLDDSAVTEDGLRHLTALTSLKLLTLPSGVTDSGMKYLRNMKLLETLGVGYANITAAGVKWLNGLKSLQVIGTEAEDVAGLIRDNFPGMVVTEDPL